MKETKIMSQKVAQFIPVLELIEPNFDDVNTQELTDSIVVYDEKPSPEVVMEIHDPDSDFHSDKEVELHPSRNHGHGILEIEPQEDHSEFEFHGLPGVEDDQFIEVKEEVLEVDDKPKEEKKVPKGPFDWRAWGLEKFYEFLKEKFSNVPKHNGKSIVGAERALNYLEELLKCISEAVRSDITGILEIEKIESIRGEIEDGIDLLINRIEKLEGSSKPRKKSASFTKEANTPHMNGLVISVPILISSVARACINGFVSAGKDIEDLFWRQVDEFDLTKREQAEVIQLLADFGYPLQPHDRLHPVDSKEPIDFKSSDNGDLAANYPA